MALRIELLLACDPALASLSQLDTSLLGTDAVDIEMLSIRVGILSLRLGAHPRMSVCASVGKRICLIRYGWRCGACCSFAWPYCYGTYAHTRARTHIHTHTHTGSNSHTRIRTHARSDKYTHYTHTRAFAPATHIHSLTLARHTFRIALRRLQQAGGPTSLFTLPLMLTTTATWWRYASCTKTWPWLQKSTALLDHISRHGRLLSS